MQPPDANYHSTETPWGRCPSCGWMTEGSNGPCTNEECERFPKEDLGVTTTVQAQTNQFERGPIQMPNHEQRRAMRRQKLRSDKEERELRLTRERKTRDRQKKARNRTKSQRIARKRGR